MKRVKSLGSLRVVFDDNDRDVPVLVEKWKVGARHPFAHGTFHAAFDTDELVAGDESYDLTPREAAFLASMEGEAVDFFDDVRAKLGMPV